MSPKEKSLAGIDAAPDVRASGLETGNRAHTVSLRKSGVFSFTRNAPARSFPWKLWNGWILNYLYHRELDAGVWSMMLDPCSPIRTELMLLLFT